MTIDKILSGRTSQTADYKREWVKVESTFIPFKGEIIVYLDYKVKVVHNENTGEDEYNAYPGIKIGNGMDYLGNLPFVATEMPEDVEQHIHNTDIHVTPEDKVFWNNKLNYEVDGASLIFNRN